MISTQDQLTQARNAKGFYPTTEQKNTALHEMATALRAQCDAILSANQADLDAAQDALSAAMLERLTLTPTILESMAKGIDEVATLPDPVGVVVSTTTRPNGLRIEKVASPMGVIAIIYESRPNVTSDAAALALKAGSVCILRSGKEAYRSAAAIVSALHKGLVSAGFPKEYITLIEDTTRDSATQLMTANGFVDLLIPRGGEGLITACVQGATVPVLETGRGICHLFIDHSADMNRALAIVENAKTSRPSVCNSAEVCLVHRDIAPTFLPLLAQKLREDRLAQGLPPVELRLDQMAATFIEGKPATPEDYSTEFLDFILAIKVVEDVKDAISHISIHSTGHSEAIITQTDANAALFTQRVDSAAVYINASTRFTDGGEFGLGCEMGISTQKLHARGPLGLAELCTHRFVVHGEGQIR